MSQARSYEDVINCLVLNKPIPKNHPLAKYRPFLDEEKILRSRSRLENTDLLPEEARKPIILSSKDSFTKLMVSHFHRVLKHPCSSEMLRAYISRWYLIPSFYYVERRVLKGCLECKLLSAKLQTQVMAPLPSNKHQKPLRAFAYCGLDYMGPFHIRQTKKTRTSRERPKYWALVIQCYNTKCVHIEATPQMDTNTTFNALSRFCDRRGVPIEITSDNQTSLKSTAKELKELYNSIDWKNIQERTERGFKNSAGIKWNFITPNSPNHGGQHESCVKAAKRALTAVYGNSELYLDEFNTALTNAERMINERPLCPTSSNPMESPPLTPQHFLLGLNGGDMVPPEAAADRKLLPRWRHLQQVQQHFWKRWLSEILKELHTTKRWKEEKRNLQVGDLVAEIDENQSRNVWPIAVVSEIYPGEDNNVRSVKLKYKSGSELDRPINKLLLLHENPN